MLAKTLPEFDHRAYGGQEDVPLKCPRCDGLYLHHGRVTVYDSGREDPKEMRRTTVSPFAPKLDVETVPNDAANPSKRRDGLTIHFTCEDCDGEDGAGLELTIAQHKGYTLFAWREPIR